MTSLERNIGGLLVDFKGNEQEFLDSLNEHQRRVWKVISGPDRDDAAAAMWTPNGVENAVEDMRPYGGNSFGDCLASCVRHLGCISWGWWTLAQRITPPSAARRSLGALRTQGLVPMPPLKPPGARDPVYRAGERILRGMWQRDGCPDLDRWCRLATVKHGLHLLHAIIDALA